jgi:predicted acylesterase/phospholipase RssA
VYEIGCLRAIDEVLGRSVADLDLYVGVSGGAFVASLMAAGISPRELFDDVANPARRRFGLSPAPIYHFDPLEILRRGAGAPRVVAQAVRTALSGQGRSLADIAFSVFELLPAGLMDTSGIGRFLHDLFVQRLQADRFDALPGQLFVVAVDLDSGEAVAFGKPGCRDVPVSRAVEASTALPGLYRPVRIGGRDYVDGGVKKTAHINLAIQNGADLVICINPIVPFLNDTLEGPLHGHLANRGVTWVLDQVMRIMLHGRMQYGMERYQRENPQVDILLIEPTRDDLRMFRYHIMRYGARRVVAEHGYRTALQYFRRNETRCRRLFAKHGIAMSDPRRVPDVPARHPPRSSLARSLDGSLDRLESRVSSRGRRASSG